MANTTKSTTNKGTTSDTKVAKLQKQVEEQSKQIEQLMQLIQAQNNVVAPVEVQTKNKEIGADDEVLVISLTPNKLNLLGEGGSVLFSFSNIYEEQYIDYASLKEIVRKNRQMAKNGRFYIADDNVVNKLRLKNDYKNILNPEQLKNIIDGNVNNALEFYKLAPTGQKATIIEIVKQKKFSGGNVDYNLLQELSKESGVDLLNVEDATQIEITQ